MSTLSFFKGIRSKKAFEISDNLPVLGILNKLALFTSRTGNEENKWVKVDYRKMGLTEQQFRSAKTYILNNELATSRATNKGTWFKLTSKSLFDINENQTTSRTTDAQRAYNNKNIRQEDITRNIYTKNIEISEPEKLPYQDSEKPLQSSAKVSPLCQQVIDLGIDMGVKLVINTGFAVIEKRYPAKKILDVAENMFTWIADHPKEKPSTARLLTFLKRDFTDQKPQRPEYTGDRQRQLEVRGSTYRSGGFTSAVSSLEDKYPDLAVKKLVEQWLQTESDQLPDGITSALNALPNGSTKRWCERVISERRKLSDPQVLA